MVEFESKRLCIRELTADDLANTLPIYLSNQDYLQFTEGSGGEVGPYDLERWQRDWYIAQFMVGRHILCCELKDSNEPVGILDYIEENDSDGKLWLGLIIIHSSFQRQRLGSEALDHLVKYLYQKKGLSLLRANVSEHDVRGRAFLQYMGFQPIGMISKQLPAGMQKLIIYEFRSRVSNAIKTN
ncbi:MAG: hypothetical protein NVSMB44_10330 [Ktedonobacteraceae bacterium]